MKRLLAFVLSAATLSCVAQPGGIGPGSGVAVGGLSSNTVYNMIIANGGGGLSVAGASNIVQTNIVVGLKADADALRYATQFSLGYEPIERLSGFVSTLKLSNLWSSVVDIYLLRTNYNAPVAANIKSWFGTNIVITGSNYDYDGDSFRITGASTIANFTNSFGKTNTIMSQLRLRQNPGTDGSGNSVFGLFNAGGEYHALNKNNGATFTYVSTGTSGWNNAAKTHAIAVRSQSGLHIVSLAQNGAEEYAWVDGVGGDDNGTSANQLYATNYIQAIGWLTNEFTRLQIGYNSASTWTGSETRYLIVFNRVLTTLEVRTVEQALRWLDTEPNNLVLYGDSRTTPNGNVDLVFYLEKSPLGQRYRVFSEGWYGYKQTTLATDNFFGSVANRRVGGPVTAGIFFHIGGYNDAAQGSNAPAITRDTTNILNFGRSLGLQTLYCTMNDYGALPALRTNYETFRTNMTYRDRVIPMEQLFPNTADTTYYVDSLHFTSNAAARLVEYINSEQINGTNWGNYQGSFAGDGSGLTNTVGYGFGTNTASASSWTNSANHIFSGNVSFIGTMLAGNWASVMNPGVFSIYNLRTDTGTAAGTYVEGSFNLNGNKALAFGGYINDTGSVSNMTVISYGGFLVKSNAFLTPPVMSEGDNWYFSSNGIPHVRYYLGGVTTTVRLVP